MKKFNIDDEVVSIDPNYFGIRGIIIEKETRPFFYFFIKTAYCVAWEGGCVDWTWDKHLEKYNSKSCFVGE